MTPILRVRRQVYHRTVLENGLRVVSAPRPQAESVAIGLWIAAGGRYENRRINGISHFLEHLLFKGSRHYSSRAIKTAIEGRGGTLNAFTDEEFTCLWAKVQPKELEKTVEVLSDMVLHPALAPKEIQKEASVIVEEIRMYKDLPMQSVHDLLNNLLWPRHPLGFSLAGTEQTVLRLRRGDLAGYQRRFYCPRNIVVAACGRLNHRRLVEGVSRLFGQVPPGRPQPFAKVREIQRKARFKIESKETEQTHLCLGFHAFPRNHPSVQALNLLNVVLGGNMSSRLFERVREQKGLAYEIGSQVKRFKDTGLFSISAGVEHRHLVRCLALILKELAAIRRQRVTPKEFEQAREFFVGQVLFSLEDTVDHMCWVGECEMLLGRIEPVEHILHQVAHVRIGDLQEAARKILQPSRLSLAVVGPVKEKVSSRLERFLGTA